MYSLALDRENDTGRWIGRLREMGQQADADAVEGDLSFVQGQYANTEQLFAGLRKSTDPYWATLSYSLQACFLAERGRYKDAIRALQDGIEADRSAGRIAIESDRLIFLGYLFYKKGDAALCHDACNRALDCDRSLQRAMQAGTLLARTGFETEAQQVLDGIVKSGAKKYRPIGEVVTHRLRGEILF